MTRNDIIRLANEAGFLGVIIASPEELERFAELVAKVEREQWPNLNPVIQWLENGCDPKEAAKELRHYAAAIRARGESK